MLRIGLFGGTFDPPHLGHLALAECARERLRLDRVLFVPAGTPPHKRGRRVSGAASRVAMTRLAVRGNPAFRVSLLEVRRRGPSLTLDTLRALRASFPGARLYLLMGADSLGDFRTWHEPDAIAALATLAVARRPGGARAGRRGASAPRVVWLDNPGLELSSSGIRARVRAGRSVRYLVPEAVAAYVARHRLYREGRVSYRPREFWEQRLSEQFDLRGTGQTGLSLAYNRACYALRRAVLDRALHAADFDPRGRRVLDVGCGTGFFTAYYLERGAALTGIDIAPISIERLRARHPGARFMLGDVSELPLDGSWDLVNAFDVLYHITEDARWERALAHLAEAVSPGGLLLVTDTFEERPGLAAHNRMRSLPRHRAVLEPRGFTLAPLRPTHVLLNRELGLLRFVNRLPGMLLAIDRALLAIAPTPRLALNKLLVARREG